jgi:hypothetical protein
MGQYQQWLFAQEVDRHLRAEREALETELLYLQDRITIMQQSVPEAENIIVQAMEAHFQAQVDTEQGLAAAMRGPVWGALPHLQTPQMQAGGQWHTPGLPAEEQRAEDVQAFFEDQKHTDPTLPAWAGRGATKAVGGEHVRDAETRRLNENVRRWFIRWRRQVVASERPEEVQNE